MAAYSCNFSTLEDKIRVSCVVGHLWLHNDILSKMIFYQKKPAKGKSLPLLMTRNASTAIAS